MTVRPADGTDDATLLGLAASIERGSEHPLASAIVAGASERGATMKDAKEFQSLTGRGVSALIDGRRVVLGNQRLMDEMSVAGQTLGEEAEVLRKQGQTVMFLAVGSADTVAQLRLAGLLGVADPVKASTMDAIRRLHTEGIRVVMVTGDNRTTADAVATQIGIDEVIAGVLPDQKGEVIKRLQSEGKVVAMAGDGVNDAPALAQAHVGIAMGTGTDVAMQSASITLVSGDLRGIMKARHLSRRTMQNIRQNLFFAFAYNALGVPVAAGLLYPFFDLLLSPMLASLAMSLSSVSVIANALRLRRLAL